MSYGVHRGLWSGCTCTCLALDDCLVFMHAMRFDSDVDLPVYRQDHTRLQKTEGRNIMTKSMKSQACAIAVLQLWASRCESAVPHAKDLQHNVQQLVGRKVCVCFCSVEIERVAAAGERALQCMAVDTVKTVHSEAQSSAQNTARPTFVPSS